MLSHHQNTGNEKISEFYKWLEPILFKISFDSRTRNDLTAKLKKFHPELRWEIGPGSAQENFLAISPNLNRDLLELTTAIASKAPLIADWEFLPAKPRKRWKNRIIKTFCQGETREYNFDAWKYYLTIFNDGEFFDVNVVPIGYDGIDVSDLQYVANLAVEFELGEEIYIDLIDSVNIVRPTNLTYETNEIPDLCEHILDNIGQMRHH